MQKVNRDLRVRASLISLYWDNSRVLRIIGAKFTDVGDINGKMSSTKENFTFLSHWFLSINNVIKANQADERTIFRMNFVSRREWNGSYTFTATSQSWPLAKSSTFTEKERRFTSAGAYYSWSAPPISSCRAWVQALSVDYSAAWSTAVFHGMISDSQEIHKSWTQSRLSSHSTEFYEVKFLIPGVKHVPAIGFCRNKCRQSGPHCRRFWSFNLGRRRNRHQNQ